MKKYIVLAGSVMIAQCVGLIGSIFTAASIDTWYVLLSKPTWNPPSWVFGPVWFMLYVCMAVAAYIVWMKKEDHRRLHALMIYGVQLALNALWSLIFFGLHDLVMALCEMLILLTCIVYTTMIFWRIDRRAGLLMIPYILWVSFAAFLSYAIWQLNG